MTPVKLHVMAYLTKHLQPRQKQRVTDNRRVKQTVYGEVLTRDELMMRLEEQEREKEAKEAEKRANKEARAEKAAQKAEEKRAAKERREVIRGEKAAERALKEAEKARKAAEKANKSKTTTGQPIAGGKTVLNSSP